MDTLSSSTSNSDTTSHEEGWRHFVRVAFITLLLLPLLGYGFVLVMDPYDNLSFSPNLDRVPVDNIQRLFHPALARKADFDSAVIGNSNIRLLRPAKLDQVLGGHFVNLGMNAASSWEQQQIFNIFVRNHEQINTLIFGMDYLWCKAEYAEMKFVGANTARDFPTWLFDQSSDNNLPPLNLSAIKHAWKQLLAVMDIHESEYGRDGYTDFTKPMSQYNLDEARIEIYGTTMPREKLSVNPAVKMTPEERAQIPIPAFQRLREMLGSLPTDSKKILFFVPYHNFYQARQGSTEAIVWEECKQRAVALAALMDNAYVVDFMIRSPITTRDRNYWDYKHYTVEVAETLALLLGKAVNDGSSNADYRILYPPSERQGVDE